MDKRRIKIGMIGIGHNHAQGKMDSLRKLSDIFELVGVVETDPVWMKKRGKLKCYEGLKWMSEEELFAIPGLDAVAVETDGFDLVPTAQRCAEHGLHIHLDKPGGESLSEFRKLLDVCENKKLTIQMAYSYRYNPAIRFAINAVKSGWLGDIFEIDTVMSRYDGDNPDYCQWLSQFKGGAMFIFAGYLIDVIVTMLGRPDKITPFMKQTRNDGLVDNGLAVMEYEHATATIRVSVKEVDGIKHRRLIVCGTKGTVEICPLETPWDKYYTDPLYARLTLKDDVPGYASGTHKVDCGMLGDRYTQMLKGFAQAVKNGKNNPSNYQHELLVQESLLLSSGYKA